VAFCIAAQGLLPVCVRNASATDPFPSAYQQLVGRDKDLPILLDLTKAGFRGGPRTGSAKASRPQHARMHACMHASIHAGRCSSSS
jgi:hypothetical protein